MPLEFKQLPKNIKTKINTNIYATEAKTTSNNIDPANYAEDLYGVLGIPNNSTSREIKDAYWKLAVKYHPDRDDSEEALQIFRNASYAYQILGKDPKTRQMYDSKGNTISFLEAIEEVGVDVVVPLARDVAIPLLNLTVQSIGAIAIPFFKDAVETSNAVVKAVLDEENENNNNKNNNKNKENVSGLRRLAQKAVQAADETGSQQNIRRNNERIERVKSNLLSAQKELESAIEKEKETRTGLPTIERQIQELKTASTAVNDSINDAQNDLDTINISSIDLKNKYEVKFSDESAMKQLLATVSDSLTNANQEVQQLEERLKLAKERTIKLTEEKDVIENKLVLYSKELNVMSGDMDARNFLKKQAQETLDFHVNNKASLTNQLSELLSMQGKMNEELERQIEYKEIIERKVSQLNKRRLALEEQAVNDQLKRLNK